MSRIYQRIHPGDRFGRLVIVSRLESTKKHSQWNCKCDCGNDTTADAANLRTGNTSSCGCLRLERLKEALTKHGFTDSKEYKVWCNMKQRCENPLNTMWHNYGGRGISVCDAWQDFSVFLNDMGVIPNNATIDRINNDGNYESSNCRWATHKEQNRNKRTSVIIEFQGKSQSLGEWAEELGIPYWTLHARKRRHWSVERMLTP